MSRNQPIITAAGIPPAVVAAIEQFDDFLRAGFLGSHNDGCSFSVDSLNASQYNALVTLTESYFKAGYEWFTPSALRPNDQDALRIRFDR